MTSSRMLHGGSESAWTRHPDHRRGDFGEHCADQGGLADARVAFDRDNLRRAVRGRLQAARKAMTSFSRPAQAFLAGRLLEPCDTIPIWNHRM